MTIDSREDQNAGDVEDSRSNSKRDIGDEANFVDIVGTDLLPTWPPLPPAVKQLALALVVLLMVMRTARGVGFEEKFPHYPAKTALLIFVDRFENQKYGPNLEQCCTNKEQHASSDSGFFGKLGT